MKGFIKKSFAALYMVGSIALMSGCQTTFQDAYYNLVDPCWPQRYGAVAARNVNEAFSAQINNGHVLDQTIWNYHFEKGEANLTPGGIQHLKYLARRRPQPDCKIYLQTAHDIEYNNKEPEKFIADRAELDNLRTQAILAFLQAETANRPLPFDVTVHDPSEVGMSAVPAQTIINDNYSNYQGVLSLGGLGGGIGVGGAGGGGAGGGGANR